MREARTAFSSETYPVGAVIVDPDEEIALHRFCLKYAMREAETAFKNKTYPVGAVIVGPDKEIIGWGHNRVYEEGDFTLHAEMHAIGAAGGKLMREEYFRRCTLYTTLEPCLMCCGATLHARIARVIWVKDDVDHGALRCLHDMTHPLSSVYVDKFNALEILNAKDILPAGEYADLASRMDDWMENWNSMKEEVLSKWQQKGHGEITSQLTLPSGRALPGLTGLLTR